MMTAQTLIENSVRKIREFVRDATDVSLLSEALEIESGADRPRSTVLGALQMRIDVLAEDQPEIVIQLDEETEEEPEPAPEIPDVVSIVASPATDPETSFPSDIGPEIETQEQLDAALAAVEEESTPEPTPEANCATAFLAALRSGDVALATVMVGELRREGADDAAMAAALVDSFSSLRVSRRRSSGSKTTKRTAGKRAALNYAAAEGVEFSFSRKSWTANGTIDAEGRTTVLAGATVNPEHVRGSSKVATVKAEMLAAGTISPEGVLAEDVTFPTASTAANFVCGDSSNGVKGWKDAEGRNVRDVCGEVETSTEE